MHSRHLLPLIASRSGFALRLLVLPLMLALLAQCVATRVTPVAGGLKPGQKVVIVGNKDDFMDEFLPALDRQVKNLGYTTEVVSQAPSGNVCYLTYEANWRWDFAMYLYYFKATLHQGGRVLGSAEYDTRHGGLDLNKFGRTENKIKPVLRQLLVGSSPGTAPR